MRRLLLVSNSTLHGSGYLDHAETEIQAVGADNPEEQELESELMAGGKIVVDVLDQCAESGDLHHALRAGVLRRSDVHAEIGKGGNRKQTGAHHFRQHRHGT